VLLFNAVPNHYGSPSSSLRGCQRIFFISRLR